MAPDNTSPDSAIGTLTSLSELDFIEAANDEELATAYSLAYEEWRNLVAGQETMQSFRDYLVRAISYYVEHN